MSDKPDLRLAEVVNLPVVTSLDLSAERVLKAALDQPLEYAIIVGYTQEEGFYFASSKANGPDVLWALEQAKRKLLEVSE